MTTFVKTRHIYDSYTDFWKLVELSGYSTVYVDEIQLDNPDQQYILSPMNGEFTAHIDWRIPKRCEILHWNLERPSGSGGILQYKVAGTSLIDQGKLDGVIVSDKALSFATGFKYVRLGSHVGLGHPSTYIHKEYQASHMSCYSNTRGFLFEYPNSRTDVYGLNIGPNCWGEQRHDVLMKTLYMLNVHQDGMNYMEPLRFALAAAYGLPIITEPLFNMTPYMSEYVIQVKNLSQTMAHRLSPIEWKYNQKYENMSKAIWENHAVTLNFKHCLENDL